MVEMKQREFNIDKKTNFSEWYNTIIYASELADIRYNIKGFLVHRPWSAIAFKQIYRLYEAELEQDGHQPVIFPTLIPEENFLKEKEHVEGFAPEVFWVTEKGTEKLERKLALRPTSETAFYQMYALWLENFKQLPMKLYQSCSVFRAEKETNPFLRGAEFLWIETHNLYATSEEALDQTRKDMLIQSNVCTQMLGIEFLAFERPAWDRFAGGEKTFAYDCLMPDGKAFQFGSTHYLGQNFTKAFDVKYMDAAGEAKFPYSTCYGPGIWRVMGAIISIHGDQKGLIFPFEVAPLQIIITPILRGENAEKVRNKALELKAKLISFGFRADVDLTDKSPGFKFNWWEMKGVPFRIELGEREVLENAVTLVRRDTKEKIKVPEMELNAKINELSILMLNALREKSKGELNNSIKSAETKDDAKKVLDEKGIAKIFLCSIEMDGRKCADELKDYTKGGKVRGVRVDDGAYSHESVDNGKIQKWVRREIIEKGKCIACGKDGIRVYLARQY